MKIALVLFILTVAVRAGNVMAEPWATLPDGRVVILVRGHRLAFEPVVAEEVRFYDRLNTIVTLAKVMADPDGTREFLASSREIVVEAGNNSLGKGLYLGRFDRTLIPHSARISLTIAAPRSPMCLTIPSNSVCKAAKEAADGLLKADDHGIFPHGASSYLLPLERTKDISPDPISIGCSSRPPEESYVLQTCLTRFMVREFATIYYEFQRDKFPEPEWIGINGRIAKALDDLILD